MEPKRILFIAPQPFLVERGSPLRVRSTLEALRDLGYDVHLLAFPLGSETSIAGVTIHRCSNPFGVTRIPIGLSWQKIVLDLSLFLKSCSLALRNQYALFHGVEESALIAYLVGKVSRRPWLMDMHSSMVDQVRDMSILGSRTLSRIISWFESFCLRRAAGVMTVSDDLTERAKRLRSDDNVHTIFDQPLPLPAATPTDVAALRRRLGLEPNELVLLYTGNFKEYQGVELLIEGFASYVKDDHTGSRPVRLVIVGGGDDPHQLERCRQLAKVHKVGELVLFVGSEPTDLMGVYYAMADILASPRLHGTNTPLKIYSYLQAEKPILATRIVSHTQVLTDCSAFLFDPTPRELATALSRIVHDPVECRSKVLNGRMLLETELSRSVFLNRLATLYGNCLGRFSRVNDSTRAGMLDSQGGQSFLSSPHWFPLEWLALELALFLSF